MLRHKWLHIISNYVIWTAGLLVLKLKVIIAVPWNPKWFFCFQFQNCHCQGKKMSMTFYSIWWQTTELKGSGHTLIAYNLMLLSLHMVNELLCLLHQSHSFFTSVGWFSAGISGIYKLLYIYIPASATKVTNGRFLHEPNSWLSKDLYVTVPPRSRDKKLSILSVKWNILD